MCQWLDRCQVEEIALWQWVFGFSLCLSSIHFTLCFGFVWFGFGKFITYSVFTDDKKKLHESFNASPRNPFAFLQWIRFFLLFNDLTFWICFSARSAYKNALNRNEMIVSRSFDCSSELNSKKKTIPWPKHSYRNIQTSLLLTCFSSVFCLFLKCVRRKNISTTSNEERINWNLLYSKKIDLNIQQTNIVALMSLMSLSIHFRFRIILTPISAWNSVNFSRIQTNTPNIYKNVNLGPRFLAAHDHWQLIYGPLFLSYMKR